jgi:hypothetical protein
MAAFHDQNHIAQCRQVFGRIAIDSDQIGQLPNSD